MLVMNTLLPYREGYRTAVVGFVRLAYRPLGIDAAAVGAGALVPEFDGVVQDFFLLLAAGAQFTGRHRVIVPIDIPVDEVLELDGRGGRATSVADDAVGMDPGAGFDAGALSEAEIGHVKVREDQADFKGDGETIVGIVSLRNAPGAIGRDPQGVLAWDAGSGDEGMNLFFLLYARDEGVSITLIGSDGLPETTRARTINVVAAPRGHGRGGCADIADAELGPHEAASIHRGA